VNLKAIFSAVVIFLAFGISVMSASAQQEAKDATAPSASAPKSPASVNKDEYVIGAGDELNITVWKEPDLTRNVPVRPDGKITVPLAGDIQASGLTPVQLEANLTKQLASYVSSPSVTVTVQAVHSQKINIVGEVNKPGSYDLNGPPMTVLDAIAMAGGLRDFAKSKKIYVLRVSTDGKQQRLPFNYKEVIKGEHMDQNIVLQARDTIVVP
jgi:polysaccharide biosynthesis/export protein